MKIGRVSGNILKRSILQQIKTRRDEVIIGASLGQDCAIVSFCGDTGANKSDRCVTISCTREGTAEEGISPVLYRCMNALAAGGGEPISLSIVILLPADSEEEGLKALMKEAEMFCKARRIQIVEAQGRVSEDIRRPYAIVTALGRVRPQDQTAQSGPIDEIEQTGRNKFSEHAEKRFHTVKAAEPGQDIVLSKWIGLEGTVILAKRHREKLSERYPAWLLEEAESYSQYLSTVKEADIALRSGVCALYNVSEGGIFAALWELAEGAGVGMTVHLKKLPLKQATVEICNDCNANPYELLSGGCLLMTCTDGAKLEAALGAEGIPAVTVGKITDSRDRLILNGDEVRYLDRPQADAIYEIEITGQDKGERTKREEKRNERGTFGNH